MRKKAEAHEQRVRSDFELRISDDTEISGGHISRLKLELSDRIRMTQKHD